MSTQRKALMGLLQDGLLQFDALLKRKSVLLGEEKKLDVSPSKSHALLAKNLQACGSKSDKTCMPKVLKQKFPEELLDEMPESFKLLLDAPDCP